MGAVVPIMFLAVAAFLLNVVMTRLVEGQREQIAALKALGVEEQRVNVVIALEDTGEASAKLGDGYRVEAGIVI